MSETARQGTDYTGVGTAEVDLWSEEIYLALADWPIAQYGKWTRWEPGYLLLSIDAIEGEKVESITVYTADEEVTVEFGHWITHFGDVNAQPKTPDYVAKQARDLVEQWVDAKIKTAVFTDNSGKWCGTILIEPGDLNKQLRDGAQRIREATPSHVELRSLRKSDWTTQDIQPEWLVAPKLSPDRLP